MTKLSISDFQRLMEDLYGSRDRSRGIQGTLIWFMAENGELIQAIIKDKKENIKEEIADVFAWLCSLSNLLDIDLEKVAWEKYPGKCPKCLSNPCKCTSQLNFLDKNDS